MDFHNMKRKELQTLCKKHNIPANLPNSQMALNLSSLLQEREKPIKRGRASSKVSTETIEEKDSSITTRQSKKVRFSPINETFEYVALRSGRKVETKVTRIKSALKPAAKKGGKPVVQEVDIKSNKEVASMTVRSLRSRVQVPMESGMIPVLNPPVGIQRGRRVGKVADNSDSTEEIVMEPVRVTRSRAHTSSQRSSVLVPEQQIGKKRGRGRAVENVDGAEPVEDIVSIPVRITRSRAQINLECGKFPALKPKGEKEILARAVVKDELTTGIVDAPVRTTRFRVKTSKECGISTMPSLPVKKKRARRGSKVDDASVQLTVDVSDSSDNVVSQKTASDQAEDLPSKRSLRKKELYNADIKGENMWQKNQMPKTAKGTCKDFEDEPLAEGGIAEQPNLCLRRSTRNLVPASDTILSKRNSDETEMVGGGKITRSRNQLMKEDCDNRIEAAIVVQRKIEAVLPVESLGRAGRNVNRRKSVIPQETGYVVKIHGDSEVVPLLEKPKKHPARKVRKGNSIFPKIDEMKAAEPKAAKGDIIEETDIVKPYTSPLRRSHRQISLLEPIALTDGDLTSVIGHRKRSGKQSLAASGGNAAAISAGNNMVKKQLGELNIDDPSVDVDAPSVEESSMRVTRSSTKSVAYQVTSSLEKITGKKKQHGTVIPNSLVGTPSGASAFQEESLAEAQVSTPEVTGISTDLVSRSNPVTENNRSKKSSERQMTRSSKQEGFKEVFANPAILEQTEGQTSVSNSKRCQIEGEKEEISVRKRKGDHPFREDRLEASPKRFTRSAPKHEKRTEWNLPENSARKKTPQSRSRPPKLVVDIDSAGKGTPSMDSKFSVPEVLKSRTGLFNGSTGVVKDRNSERNTRSGRCTRSSRQGGLQDVHAEASNVDELKGQLSTSISRKLQTDARLGHKGISDRKKRGDITFEEVDVGLKCTPSDGESSRRLTRSAFKSNSNVKTKLTRKDVGKKKFKNQSETPKLEVKSPSADRSLASNEPANNNDAHFSLPEAVKSASVQSWEVIGETSTEMGKKVISNACALNEDVTEEVCAQTSNITKGKEQASKFEETLASESEILQIDDIEKEEVVSVNETAVITATVIAPGDEPIHVINGIATSTAFSNLGLPNLEKGTPLEEGISTHSIDFMPEVIATAAEQSIEIEHTSGQEPAKQFIGTAGMTKSESIDFEMEFPSEKGTSALDEALNIADVPEVSGKGNCPFLSSSGVFEHSSPSHIKNFSTGSHVNEEVSSEEVYAENLSMDEKKGQGQKEREMDISFNIASESLQIDDREKEEVVSVNETAVITATVIAPGDEPMHVINGTATSTVFSNMGLPNLEKGTPLEDGISTHSIDFMPEVIATAAEQSIEIEHTSGQEPARQFIGTAGMTQSESIYFEMEFPSEKGTSALDEVLNIADVPEVSGKGNCPFLSSSGVFEHNSPSHIKKFSTGSHVSVEVSSEEVYAENLSMDEKKGQGQKEREMDNSFNKVVDVAENVNIILGVDQDKLLQCSAEMVNDYGPGSHCLERSGLSGSSELADQEMMEELCVADDGFEGTTFTAVSCLPVEQSHSPNKAEAMHEPPQDTLPSPAASDVLVRDSGVSTLNDQDGGRANQDDSNLNKERNHDVDETEINIEFAKPHESSSSPASQSKELKFSFRESSFDVEESPLQVPEVIENANTLSSSSKEPHINAGPFTSNETVDLVDMNLEKGQDFSLQTSENEHKMETDLALEESSVDHNHNSDYTEIIVSRICDVAVPGTVGSDDFGFENKMEYAAAEDDSTPCEEIRKFVESSELDEVAQRKVGEYSSKRVGEISGSGSFNQEKDMEGILDVNDNDVKASNVGRMIDTITGSVCIDNQLQRIFESPTSKDTQESEDRVPVEECQPENCPSKEDQLQSEQGEENALLSTCEDIYFGDFVGDWNEDTMPTLFATPASSSISSKNARSYCDDEIADIAFSDSKTREIRSGESHSNCFKSNLGEDKKHESELKSQMIFVKLRENSPPVAEEQPGQPKDHTRQICVSASDRIIHEDYELSEGFDADADTEQYFHSENTENADFGNFGGMTQEFLTEVAAMSGRDNATLDEPEVKDEVNRIDGHDRRLVGGTGEESGKVQPEEAPSDKNTRTETPSDMTSRTDPSVSVDFAIHEGI